MKEFSRTKLTITLDYDLKTLKQAYRNFFGQKGRVTKSDVASWAGSLAEADIADYTGKQETEDEENERLINGK